MTRSVPYTAAVRSPLAPMNGEPRVSASQTSQSLRGAVLHVVDADGDWLRVRGDDGYEGWTHRGYLHEPGAPAAAPAALSLGCRVRRADGRALRLPLGALVLAGEPVLDGDSVATGALPARFPRDARAVLASAERFFEGTPYEWGGVSAWGADCSGFVQRVFALHGLPLPRDAWQQALVGADAGTDPTSLAAGDLLFFSDRDDRRVTHVGLSAGGARMLHLALGRGGWADDDLADDRDPYVARLRANFLHARRVL